jgi:hypothetical protein
VKEHPTLRFVSERIARKPDGTIGTKNEMRVEFRLVAANT